MSGAQTFREALRTLVFRWSASMTTAEIIAELTQEIEVLKPLLAPKTQKDILRDAMDAAGIADPEVRAGIAAIAGGEAGFKPRTEVGYAHTSNARIRMLFGSRVPDDDAELTALKANDEAFFNRVYGGEFGRRNLGNTEPGDGYRYRGRGDFQLTGRGNYVRMGAKLGVDLVGNPDLANDPVISARIAVAYIMLRYHGGGFEGMKRAVGNVSSTEETKDRLFAQYMASGEFA